MSHRREDVMCVFGGAAAQGGTTGEDKIEKEGFVGRISEKW